MLYNFLLASLLVVNVARAELPDCPSVGVDRDNLDADCATLCGAAQASTSEDLDITETVATQVYKCECDGTDTGCMDEVVLFDRTVPLPTCDEIGLELTNTLVCKDVCDTIGKDVDVFRDVNGETKCFCKDGWDVCRYVEISASLVDLLMLFDLVICSFLFLDCV